MSKAGSRMEQRINLRLSNETYRPYERLAQLLTGLGRPITATQIVRDIVETYVEQMEINIAYAEAALRGDKVSQERLFDAMLDLHQAQLNASRAVQDAEGRNRVMGIGDEAS